MALKSNFKADLKKEKQLHLLLDSCYSSKLKHYTFKRITDINSQHKGIDVVFNHKEKAISYLIDEKAQLDYIDEDLPTFAFELSYLKNGIEKEGWLFDQRKKTDFYALITAIYAEEKEKFSHCKITLVNRKKLVAFLIQKGIHKESDFLKVKTHGKHDIATLNQKKEGYLYYSKNNKSEQPINLILRLDYLIKHKLAKRLV